jgi:outer membrane immunogenic protein
MLRMRILGASLIALSAGIGTAAAADLYTPASPQASYGPTPGFNWNGPEIGLIVGYGWGNAKNAAAKFDADGWAGGAYAGYNFQPAQNIVLGIEGDITASGMDGSVPGLTVRNNWNATLRARAGYAFDRFLIYGTGGLAVGGLKVENAAHSDDKSVAGWTLGGGLAAGLTNAVTARLEYRYTDLGSHAFATSPTKVDFSSNQLFAGVGMKF